MLSLRKRLLFSALAGAVCLATGASFVLAQTEHATPAAPAAAKLSPGDMVKQADSYTRKMQETVKRIVHLQDVARREKDVIKLNCVNDKLQQARQLVDIADTAATNMQVAIARNDEGARDHELNRVAIAYQQVASLGTESENCIGEDITFVGDTDVSVEAPEIPQDPTATPELPPVQPLPVASPRR